MTATCTAPSAGPRAGTTWRPTSSRSRTTPPSTASTSSSSSASGRSTASSPPSAAEAVPASDAIAEALAPSTRKGTERPCDADLGIHYTGGLTADGDTLGSIAVLVPAKVGGELRMWRFGDPHDEPVDLSAARELSPVRVPTR